MELYYIASFTWWSASKQTEQTEVLEMQLASLVKTNFIDNSLGMVQIT